MKQFQQSNFEEKEDIQIQTPTCRLHFNILVALNSLPAVMLRARLVTPNGPRILIERTPLVDLLEIASQGEGFYRVDYSLGQNLVRIEGHVEVARDGALPLNTGTYLSVDITCKAGNINFCELHALQHAKTTNTYLHYNPVTINQALQSVPLDRATHLVLPVARIREIELTYPTATVPRTQVELRSVADASNDIVCVNRMESGLSSAIYGYNRLVIVPVRDPLSLLDATRVQVERDSEDDTAFNVVLVEEKSL